MQTATFKEATAMFGVALDDVVRYKMLDNRAIIQLELKSAHNVAAKGKLTAMPEEELQRKYSNITSGKRRWKALPRLEY